MTGGLQRQGDSMALKLFGSGAAPSAW